MFIATGEDDTANAVDTEAVLHSSMNIILRSKSSLSVLRSLNKKIVLLFFLTRKYSWKKRDASSFERDISQS